MPLVTIGGGELAALQTLAIDREIVRLAGTRTPRALFVPTASDDAEGYVDGFRAVYGERLGCRTDVLLLVRDRPSAEAIARKIVDADLIYVGGGNTLRMMRIWRRLGVDRLLSAALGRGCVLSGLSAGMLCWYEFGHSDSMSFYHPEDWDYIRVRGLGFLPATACPHYDGEQRDCSFQAMIGRHGGVGLAADDGAALVFEGDRWRVIASRSGAAAYKVFRDGGHVVTERLTPTASSGSMSGLFAVP